MRLDIASAPSSPTRPNEDFVAAAVPAGGHGGALVLLDGVTPPAGDDGCRHGLPWYTAHLGGALLELATANPAAPLAGCLAEAVARTARAHGGGCDLGHPRTPQATVVAVRWNPQAVEYLVLSDSVLLLDHGSTVEAVLDDRLDRLPASVEEAGARVRALPPGTPERAAAADAYVAAVEALRNADGGFFTAAADPSVADRAVTGAVPRVRVRAVAGYTDGATRLVETFHVTDWAGLLEMTRKEGAQELLARVRAEENAALASGVRRHKLHDDATAALVEL